MQDQDRAQRGTGPATAGRPAHDSRRGKAPAGAGQGLRQEERIRLTAGRLTAGRGVRPATGGREPAADEGQAGGSRKSKPVAGGRASRRQEEGQACDEGRGGSVTDATVD